MRILILGGETAVTAMNELTGEGGFVASSPREIELKLEVEPECDEALLSHPLLSESIGDAQQSISVYYDTKGKSLREAGLTLRVRKTGDRFVQTVKSNGRSAAGLFERDEWEVPIAGPEPDLDLIQSGPTELANPDIRSGLRPMFKTLVDRRATVIDRENSRIELVVDQGEVVAGDKRQPLFEVELELIEGSPATLFDIARELQTRVPVKLGVLSKSERGERLANGKGNRALKAEPVRLSETMSANEAFRVIAFACLRHFRANEPLVATARDPDALHQGRVALRRLRSAFSLFRPILKGSALDRFREEVRRLAAALGDARNLDVLIKRHAQTLSATSLDRLTDERTRAYDSAMAALRSPATGAMLIDLAEWVALGERPHQEKAERPIGPFSAKVLDRFWNRVRRGGRRLGQLDDEERHELRIAGKKLRYACEFFSALYAGAATKPAHDAFLGHLETLQDGLGGLNDLATEAQLHTRLCALGIELPIDSRKAARTHRRELIHASADAFDKLDRIGPFWRA